MRTKPRISIALLLMICLWPVVLGFPQTLPSETGSKAVEFNSSQSLINSGIDGQIGSLARIQQSQKLMDDKNYEIISSIRVPSINGGDRLDREIREKARKISDSEFRIDRTVQTADSNGRLGVSELNSEEHLIKGAVEEIKRSSFRPDINGKLSAQSTEQETIIVRSKGIKEITKALYRPDAEGRLSLAEVEEGSEKRLSDMLSTKEVTRQVRDPNGRMVVAGNVKETTTKTGQSEFEKESLIRKADDNGRLQLTERILESQTEVQNGTKKYERLLESRTLNLLTRSTGETGLIPIQRVTGEERRLPDGTIENTIQVERLDPYRVSDGLRLHEVVTETSRPLRDGRVSVERVVKTRDVNNSFVVTSRTTQIVEAAK
jgi:hypothetical protein